MKTTRNTMFFFSIILMIYSFNVDAAANDSLISKVIAKSCMDFIEMKNLNDFFIGGYIIVHNAKDDKKFDVIFSKSLNNIDVSGKFRENITSRLINNYLLERDDCYWYFPLLFFNYNSKSIGYSHLNIQKEADKLFPERHENFFECIRIFRTNSLIFYQGTD